MPWCKLPKSESYYADGFYGMTGRLEEAIRFCLDKARDIINRDPNIQWGFFNLDGDEYMDSIAVIHSGFGAEWGESDCYTRAGYADRIWSHKWSFGNHWQGWADGKLIKVRDYHVSPGLWVSFLYSTVVNVETMARTQFFFFHVLVTFPRVYVGPT